MLHNTVPRSIAALDWLHSTGIFPLRAGEAYTGQAAVVGKCNAAIGIVPCIGLIALQHGELDAVNGLELLQGHTQCHGGKYINFYQSLPPLIVRAQGRVPCPLRGQRSEASRGEARVGFGPSSERPDNIPTFFPKGSVIFIERIKQ